MNRTLPVAAGVAGAAIVAVIAVSMWGGSNRDGVGTAASGRPSASSTAPLGSAGPRPPLPSRQPTASPPFEGVRAFEDVPGGGWLAPGTYSLSAIEPLEIRFTVPNGWERPPDAPEFLGPTGQNGREIGGLSFWTPVAFHADPCRSAGSFLEMRADATVSDVARRLTNLWDGAMSAPTAITLSGFSGVLASVPATCERAIATYRILDVDGHTLIVLAHVWGQTKPEEAAELEAMVDSIEIEVTGAASSRAARARSVRPGVAGRSLRSPRPRYPPREP